MAVAIRFSLEDTQSKDQDKLERFVNVETEISLLLWVQGYALRGTYLFVGAIVTSQIVGFVLIYIGQSYTRMRQHKLVEVRRDEIGTLTSVSPGLPSRLVSTSRKRLGPSNASVLTTFTTASDRELQYAHLSRSFFLYQEACSRLPTLLCTRSSSE